jgi:hypothetical protein
LGPSSRLKGEEKISSGSGAPYNGGSSQTAVRLPIWDHGSGKLGFLFFVAAKERSLFSPPIFHFHFSLLFTVSLGAARVDGRASTWEGFGVLNCAGPMVGTADERELQ